MEVSQEPPKLARRKENRKSTLKSGRTIGERRERLETASERMNARKKVKQKQNLRLGATIVGFLAVALIIIFAVIPLLTKREAEPTYSPTFIVPYSPTIEVVDEDALATGGELTSRMKEYIGRAEADFRALGYSPTRAVIPTGAIREVRFYLDGYTGFIKLIIDRDTAISVEDADRMIRYLANLGVTDFEYIDVRIDGKAYWK